MTTAFSLMTWNINSVRLRLPTLAHIVASHQPDIICLQETKVCDEAFPHEAIDALGYPHRVIRGEKSYNGVAILSRLPLHPKGALPFGGMGDTRHLMVTLPCGTELHNTYVPAGGDEPDVTINPKFVHKLTFLEDMQRWFKQERNAGHSVIIVGDLNVAPLPDDVWSHKQLLRVVSHTEEEVTRLNALQETLGFIDVARHFVPPPAKLYSWWSYRNRDWRASDRGRRLDHIWVTQPLRSRLKRMETLKDARDLELPSDHVPVMVWVD